jgi:hypothetical protein
MAEVAPKFGWPGLQVSYTCAAAVTGGQIVERRTGTRLVGPAASGSLVACGVARWDVPATRASIQGPQVGDGNELTVVRRCIIKVTAQGAITVGAKLIVGSVAGTAAVAGATPDARSIIGEAFEAASDTATFLAFIY